MNDTPGVGAGERSLETQLLLDYLQADLDLSRARLQARRSPTDLTAGDWASVRWKPLVTKAIQLGVGPLLFYRLKTLDPEVSIPAEAEHELHQVAYQCAVRNVRLYYELGRVLRALREEGIPVIVLKGAHLAQVVYSDLELRPMGDVDLLVRERDLERVESCLLGLGCTREAVFGHGEESAAQADLNSHNSYRMAGPDLFLEVHWDIRFLQSPFTFAVDDLWERACPATIADVPVAVLSPEDLVLHLCLHAAFRHTFEMGLKPLCDLSEVARHYRDDLDWTIVQERARQWGAGLCVYVTLYHTQKLLGAAVPEHVLRGLAPQDGDMRFVAWAERQILGQVGPVAGPLSDGWGRLWAADRFGKKVAALVETLFPSPRFLAAKYGLPPGTRRVYLYYPIFLKDLVRRHAARAWRLWRRDEATSAWAEHEAQRAQVKAWLVHRVGRP